jgi:hypothetical protein
MGIATQQLVRSGAQSAVFEITPPTPASGGDSAYIEKADWEGLPKGALRDLMFRPYVKSSGGVDAEGFIAAQARAGFVASTGLDPVLEVQLVLDSRPDTYGYPFMTVTYPVAAANNYVKLAVSYSASE